MFYHAKIHYSTCKKFQFIQKEAYKFENFFLNQNDYSL